MMKRHAIRRIRYTTNEEIRHALVEFAIFICFLILTTVVTLTVRHPYMFYMNSSIDKLFVRRDVTVPLGSSISFSDLVTVQDLWDYFQVGFLNILHGGYIVRSAPTNDNSTNTTDSAGQGNAGNATAGAGNVDQNENPGFSDDYGDNFNDDVDEAHFMMRQLLAKGPHVHRPGSSLSNSTVRNLIGRVFLRENVLLGPPRLRQIRVKKDSCFVNDAFIRYFNTCYGPYSTTIEDTSNEFKGSKFYTLDELSVNRIWAHITTYKGAGYVQMLTYDRSKNEELLRSLRAEHWLDRASRLAVMEFNLYNDNLDSFQSIKLIAELPPTGGVISSARIDTMKEFSFFTEQNYWILAAIILFYIMVLYYTAKAFFDIRGMGFKRYFLSLVEILDTVILIFAYAALGYNIWHTFHIKSVERGTKIEDEFASLDNLTFFNTGYVDMMALLNFLVWIKIFKFISFNKTLVQFSTTLRRCSKDLAGFSLMFLIVFLAYAQLGLLLFGTQHPDFRNFLTSVLTMIRMILGDFNYELIEKSNRILGPIYFLTYILLVFFILLNMFLAIIMQTYSSVKAEITEGNSQLGSYVFKKIKFAFYFIRYCGKVPQHLLEQISGPSDDATPTTTGFTQARPDRAVDQPSRQNLKQQTASQAYEKELNRLTNRVGILEDMLEQLINNMDSVLKKVERKKKKNE